MLQLKVITGTAKEIEFEVNDFLKLADFEGMKIKSASVDLKSGELNATIWYETKDTKDEWGE